VNGVERVDRRGARCNGLAPAEFWCSDARLSAERAEAVDAYLAAHPEARARLSQYAEQRQALRRTIAAQAGGLIPTRLRVAHLLAKPRRRRHR
jgi:anti-sigma factor RsiW